MWRDFLLVPGSLFVPKPKPSPLAFDDGDFMAWKRDDRKRASRSATTRFRHRLFVFVAAAVFRGRASSVRARAALVFSLHPIMDDGSHVKTQDNRRWGGFLTPCFISIHASPPHQCRVRRSAGRCGGERVRMKQMRLYVYARPLPSACIGVFRGRECKFLKNPFLICLRTFSSFKISLFSC